MWCDSYFLKHYGTLRLEVTGPEALSVLASRTVINEGSVIEVCGNRACMKGMLGVELAGCERRHGDDALVKLRMQQGIMPRDNRGRDAIMSW